MSTLKKVSQQTLWQLIGKVITSISTILILSFITRSYGESGTGLITLALTYLSFFALIADFGLNAHILPEFLKDDYSLKWQKLFGFRIILTIIAVALTLLIAFFLPVDLGGFNQGSIFKILVAIGTLSIIEIGIFLTASAIFQSKLKYQFPVIATTIGTLITLGAVFLVSSERLAIPFLMLGYGIGWIVTAVISLLLSKQYLKFLFPVFDLNFIKRIIKEVWPISATLILNVVYFRIDSFIITSVRNFAEVGIYNLAFQIFQASLALPVFIMNSFYPILVADFTNSIFRFKSKLKKGVFLMFLLGVLAAFLAAYFAPLIINLMSGGKGFSGSITSLQILSLSFPAFFITSLLMWVLIIYKKYKTMLIIYMLGLIFNLIANLIFIPQYSFIAASWVTVLSEYLILVLQLFVLFPKLRVGK